MQVLVLMIVVGILAGANKRLSSNWFAAACVVLVTMLYWAARL